MATKSAKSKQKKSDDEELRHLREQVLKLTRERDALKIVLFGRSPDDDKGRLVEVAPGENRDLKEVFRIMTPRHHATLQMIFNDKTTEEIGRRFGYDVVNAKTYTTGLYKHLGIVKRGPHNKRRWVVEIVKPFFDAMDDEEYLAIAGIPKDWDTNYVVRGPEYAHVFKHRKVKKTKRRK